MVWDVIISFCFLLGLFVIPFEVAFHFHEDRPFFHYNSYVLLGLDIAYMLDIMVRMNTGFVRNKVIVLNSKEVLW